MRQTNKRIFFSLNRRQWTLLPIIFSTTLLVSIVLIGFFFDQEKIATNLSQRNLPPSVSHFFGTDWLGRDMFSRTMMGLSFSIRIGLIGSIGSTIIAVMLGMASAIIGSRVDHIISWVIDLFLSVPHLVTLILISFTLGGGTKGIVVGLMLTHWPSLARVIRAEVMQLRSADYVSISYKLGRSKWWVAYHHIFPQLLPQIMIGFILLFPHAILHEASVTFLGFGLSPHEPAIGIILSEAMKFLTSGMWWLAFFPGISLLLVVRLFDINAEKIQKLLNPIKFY